MELNSANGIFHIWNELMTIIHSKKQWITVLVVFAILLGVRFYYIGQKRSMYIDEGLSISICNRNESGFWRNGYQYNHEYTGKELKEISLWDDASVRDALSDVYHLHQSNWDTPHTNFYYSLFRLWFTGVKTYNLKYIYWRGCLLNVLFFAISFFFMMLLIRRFTDNWVIQASCLLIAFINPASLSLTVFMRPYELQQTFVVILAYYIVCCLQNKQTGKKIETKGTFAIGTCVLALAMLSAYFNMILISIYGLFIISCCIYKKDYRFLKFSILLFVISLIVAKILYFDFGNLDYRGEQAASNLQVSNLQANIDATIIGILKIIFKNVFFGLFCVLVLVLSFSKKVVSNKPYLLSAVVIINIISFCIIMYFAPIEMKTLRYVAPLFPIFALFFVDLNNQRIPKIVIPVVAVFLLALSLIQFNGTNSVVEHLDDLNISSYKDIKGSKYPLFIRGKDNYKYACLIPYLCDESKVIFISDFSEIQQKYANSIPCLFINQKSDSLKSLTGNRDINVQQLSTTYAYDVYLIK